jgi:hypothetical protein
MITAEIMAGLWTALALLAIYVSRRTRFVPLLFVATGALTWIVFYAVTICGCWSNTEFAVIYSRWGNAWTVVNLALLLVTIYRGRAHGLD